MIKEEEIISQFQNKNINAFEMLFEKYGKSIKGVIYNIVKDFHTAEEVLQDVFVKAWRNAVNYDPKKGRFFTWLVNIARNTSIDVLRSKQYKKKTLTSNPKNFLAFLHSKECIDRKTNTIGLRRTVATLEKKYRRLIELLYFKGYTQVEVAKQMNIPLGTVKTNNRKGINQLRGILSNEIAY